jgi:UPF0716 protein FxsA
VALLVALLIAVPIIELYVFVQVAGWIGFWSALGLLILVSLGGLWLVKLAGLSALRRAQVQVANRQVPAASVADGLALLLAGLLLLFPGFVTAVAGLLLLLPPVRAGVRSLLTRRWSGRVRVLSATHHGPIVETTATERRPELDS